MHITFRSSSSSFEARLAKTPDEVIEAQSLRYRVFCGEWGASSGEDSAEGLEQDHYDPHCDHLLVYDKDAVGGEQLVAACRLLGDDGARLANGYYTQASFNLDSFASDGCRHIEVSRVCIDSAHRSKRIMELIWYSIWTLCRTREIDVMFGCASFVGTDPSAYPDSFGWLSDHAQLSDFEDYVPCSEHSFKLSEVGVSDYNERRTFATLPALLKSYLRLGARIGSYGVIDYEFGSLDVLIILKCSEISEKYLKYYGEDSDRFDVRLD